jgi:hypothetical protein
MEILSYISVTPEKTQTASWIHERQIEREKERQKERHTHTQTEAEKRDGRHLSFDLPVCDT